MGPKYLKARAMARNVELIKSTVNTPFHDGVFDPSLERRTCTAKRPSPIALIISAVETILVRPWPTAERVST